MFESTMMDIPLTIDMILDRARHAAADVEVVSRQPDRRLHKTTYGAIAERTEKLARALIDAGIQPRDRVATLMWNHAQHLECYLGIPLAGAVIHTLNLRLHPDEIAFIARDAQDRFLVVDEVLLPLFEAFRSQYPFEKVIVVGTTKPLPPEAIDYEDFLKRGTPGIALPKIQETDPLGCCYTSGTTGKPKGVVYSHRSTILHSLVTALPDSLDLSMDDCLMAVVPMFHVNAWGLPYTATLVGTRQILPGPFLDAASLVDLMETEKVTVAAGVPTIWMSIREELDARPRELKARMVVGGAAAPEKLIRDFDRMGLQLIQAWGMTETSPVGLVSRLSPAAQLLPVDEQYKLRAKQGRPAPLVQVRVCNEEGEVPLDGKTSGELQIRGPWITQRYASGVVDQRWTDDGYFKTGDVANLDALGYVQLTDRTADLIKSGGEWIASQVLENAIMGHPAVREAAVIGVPHPKWSERPLAVVVLKPGCKANADDLRDHLAPHFAKFQLPDAFVFADTIPRTSAGKFKKTDLRQEYCNWTW
ncbi:MAG TPA: long-chain fatty acid--CoA ligase [Oligoflexus sp.]|uniref:long-chain fatty acid--CoA ligase n=1 Tax=Oligoflexus sp. TaxID=1971216 RepID=UPI002D63BFB0|nr:long-chain fatty acid--CoA ligase [Oligoflexus sp.]HYX31846.1 long-chain fatty acid--CoA ligase [Oligoflexus sp.]